MKSDEILEFKKTILNYKMFKDSRLKFNKIITNYMALKYKYSASKVKEKINKNKRIQEIRNKIIEKYIELNIANYNSEKR